MLPFFGQGRIPEAIGVFTADLSGGTAVAVDVTGGARQVFAGLGGGSGHLRHVSPCTHTRWHAEAEEELPRFGVPRATACSIVS